jgi:hypothetical protein
MDFIERIFGISPDAGSGAFELILVAVPILILASLAAYRRWRCALPNRVSCEQVQAENMP